MQPTRKADALEEFDEADFFDEEGDQTAPQEDEDTSSSGWGQQQEELQVPASSRAHGESGPGSNKSANTTIMQDVIHEDEPVEVFRAAMPIAASLPMQHQTVRMGSSVPMNIPFLGKAMKQEQEDKDARDEVQYPGTFIPPHQLSHHDGFMFSLTGASPSIAKKERLRARNAILMSTGFLENQASLPPVQERAKIVAKPAGGLSQALQSS